MQEHQRRLLLTFDVLMILQLWLARVPGPSPLLPAHERALYMLRLQYDIWREFAAIAWYWLLGYLC